MEPFSIFITSAPKDEKKVPFLLESINNCLEGWDDVHLITTANENAILLRAPFERCSYRRRWIYQQFLKLFQTVTKHDLYLTIDADLVFNRPMPLFENGKRIWWRGRDQYNKAYYEFNKRLLGLDRLADHTFLMDMNFFDRRIITEMLECLGMTKEVFIERSIDIITHECHPSEADIYGQYCAKYHPDLYEVRRAKVYEEARWTNSIEDQVWPDLKEKIESAKGMNIDVMVFNSWFLETV